MTSNKTLQEYQKSIPPRLLLSPRGRVFRQAIEVTRALGFRYLWIDSICINQEDGAEKASEISRMAQIYQNASLNISATQASAGVQGLFANREPLSVAPVLRTLEGTESGAGAKQNFLAVMIHPSQALSTSRWEDNVQNAPIQSRGWVLQERLLAPRVVHFCKEQVYWECRESTACQTDPDGSLFLATKKVRTHDTPKRIFPVKQGTHGAWLGAYDQVVSMYAQTKLSFCSDRLLAISAIASNIAQQYSLPESDYVAGMWRKRFLNQLSWRTGHGSGEDSPPMQCSNRNCRHGGPSWSWASLHGSIEHLVLNADNQRHDRALASVEHVSTSRRDESAAFGEVTQGLVRLRCCVVPFEYISMKFLTVSTLFKKTLFLRCISILGTDWQWIPDTNGNGTMAGKAWVDVKTYFNDSEEIVAGESGGDSMGNGSSARDREEKISIFWDSSAMYHEAQGFHKKQDGKKMIEETLFLAPTRLRGFSRPLWDVEGIVLRRASERGQFYRIGAFITGHFERDDSVSGAHFGRRLMKLARGEISSLGDHPTRASETDSTVSNSSSGVDGSEVLDEMDYLEIDEMGKYQIELI